MAVVNFATFAQSLPYATRILTLLLIAFSVTLALLRMFLTSGVHIIPGREDTATEFPYLVIVPGSSFFSPWTLITSAFCETTVPEFIISLVSLTLAGRYLERIWGPNELLRFALVVIVGSNVIAWFLAVALFLVTRIEVGMYHTQYHGLEALQTAFLVAFAQLIPEHQLQFKFGVKIRVRDLPMAYVTFSNVACLLGYMSPFILIQFGWLIGWAYLRFFKENESGIRGDRSETFSFVSWFPPFLHKPVTIISNFLYKIFLRVGVVQPWQYSAMGDVELGVGSGLPGMSVGMGGAYGAHGGSGSGGGVGAPGHPSGTGHVAPYATRAEAERRRAMALKALDQRVKAGAVNGSATSPASVGTATTNGGSGQQAGYNSPYTAQAAGTGGVARPAVAASQTPAKAATNGRGARRSSASAHSSESAPTAGGGLQPNGASQSSSGVPRVVVHDASEEALNTSAATERGAEGTTPSAQTSPSAKASS